MARNKQVQPSSAALAAELASLQDMKAEMEAKVADFEAVLADAKKARDDAQVQLNAQRAVWTAELQARPVDPAEVADGFNVDALGNILFPEPDDGAEGLLTLECTCPVPFPPSSTLPFTATPLILRRHKGQLLPTQTPSGCW
jgi:hypothetical protein